MRGSALTMARKGIIAVIAPSSTWNRSLCFQAGCREFESSLPRMVACPAALQVKSRDVV